MATALERAVDALSNSEVGLPDALRALLVVSRRIDATELTSWLRGELDGYDCQTPVPAYRAGERLPIDLRFDGPMGSSMPYQLSAAELPDSLGAPLRQVNFREPLAELVELSQGDRDPVMQLPAGWVEIYRRLAEEQRVPSNPMMVLNYAAVKMPRTHLKGIIDRVRTAALDLALSIEDISAEAGASGGPTVEDEPRLAQQVTIHLTQLFGDGATLTVGDHATVASGPGSVAVSLSSGDVDGLLEAARALVGEQAVSELASAIDEDGGEPGEATNRFLDRVKQGSVVLAGGVTTNGAYDGLVALLGQVFGG
jgi:hypothetical protein